jgi:hypothetical protein
MTKWWGQGIGGAGWACIVYEWGYSPLCRFFGYEPWTITWYGGTLVAICVVLNLFQWSLDAHPERT